METYVAHSSFRRRMSILKVSFTRIHQELENRRCNLLQNIILPEVLTVGDMNGVGLAGGDMRKLHHILLRIKSAGKTIFLYRVCDKIGNGHLTGSVPKPEQARTCFSKISTFGAFRHSSCSDFATKTKTE